MTETSVLTVLIVALALAFLAESMRRGLGRALAATAVMGTWLGVTLSALRRSDTPGDAAEAARDYALIMSLVLFLYFYGKSCLLRWYHPVPRDQSEALTSER